MKKKGFTLVELLGVITILGILALIAVPTIDAIMTKNREKMYNTQIETIKNGLKTWGDGNSLALPEKSGDYIWINLDVLKKSGFVEEDITDPTTDACFSNDMVLTITKVGEGYSYHVDEESGKGGSTSDCESSPEQFTLLLKGSTNIEIITFEEYFEPGYFIFDEFGKVVNDSPSISIVDKNGLEVDKIDTTKLVGNIYTITYEYNGIKKTRKINYVVKLEYVFEYTGAVQKFTLPAAGKWKLEVWGAQGGYRSSTSYGGKGGYSVGYINFTETVDLYINVGGSGNNGGFNGGGLRQSYNGGGGASDIRIGQDSLYARVIVAGGGGSDGATNKNGMYGGGTSGGSSSQVYGSLGYGGTISGNSGGSTYIASTTTDNVTNQTSAYSGFGFGGNGIYYASGYGGAGGGGWYGGTGAYPDGSGDDDRGGGGGSGWVYTADNYSAWQTGNPTDAANWLLNSSYYLTDAETIDGATSFLDPDGTSVTGHSGNGYARITLVS